MSPSALAEARQERPPALVLPHASEVPLLLTQLQRIATSTGLAWQAGDYRLLRGTGTTAASLEVRTSFKAPYPRLREFLTRALDEVPASTLKELSLTRQNSDIGDVDVRVVLTVFLRDVEPATGSDSGGGTR